MAPLDQAVAALTATQYGVISRVQARQLGLSPSAIQHRRESGRWTTLQPQVYAIAGVPMTWRTRVLAACLSTGGTASHRTAAALHDVPGYGVGEPEVTIPRGRQLDREGLTIHESVDLHRTSPMLIANIPTSSPSRLAVDLGAVVPFERYVAAMDDLLARRVLTWPAALQSLLAHSRQGRNGCGALRALLDQRYGDDVPESMLERAFLAHFDHLTIPRPVQQFDIHDAAGFVARADFAYPRKRIMIELDGVRYHLTAEAFEADRHKRNRLRVDGWLVLEYTHRMLVDRPTYVFRQLERAYRERPDLDPTVRDLSAQVAPQRLGG